MEKPEYHNPVMVREVIEGLQIVPSGTYVDCTFGGGGHSAAILHALGKKGRVIAFDQDPDAARNLPEDNRLILVQNNFRHLRRFLRLHHVSKVNGILADLGVSSHQINEVSRGFSTRFNTRIDMRMNPKQTLDAERVINKYSEEKLHKIFEEYGEVTNSKTLARRIVEARRSQSIKTVTDFRNSLYPVVKGNPEKYFAQVFQAIRIEVNDEFGSLKEMLQQIPEVLVEGGRVVIITFHSLEDRIVKNFFKNGSSEDSDTSENIYGKKKNSVFKVITKKPITPSEKELKENSRSRSAKLRIAEKNFSGEQSGLEQ
jgi:16S rRNA (cytosine1402-N4)-methyltransferase